MKTYVLFNYVILDSTWQNLITYCLMNACDVMMMIEVAHTADVTAHASKVEFRLCNSQQFISL